MTDSKKEIARLLAGQSYRQEIDAEVSAFEAKQQALIAADEVIFSVLGRWTGTTIKRGDDIPIVRDGATVGTLVNPAWASCPVKRITDASLIEHKAEIDRKISDFEGVADAADALVKALARMSLFNRFELDNSGSSPYRNVLSDGKAPLEERIISEIGIVSAARIAALALTANAVGYASDWKKELKKRKRKPGRPRNEAAHAVARELALLYAKVTGKRPTYSEGADGLSGEYSPALRDVFDALGWRDTGIKGPAQAAIGALTEADMKHEEMALSGLFSSALPE